MTLILIAALALAGRPEVHEIRHDGLTFSVVGTRDRDGTISWNPDDPANRRAWDAARRRAAETAIPNFGINPDRRFHGPGEVFRAPSPEGRRFIEEVKQVRGGRRGAEEDARLHVTVIGPAAERAQVVRDLNEHPALKPLRDRILLQDYDPSAWAVDPSLGFQVDGRPTILIQGRSGRVAWRAADYAVGPEGLAEAIRRADPDYRPERDPGPANAGAWSCPLGFTGGDWPAVLIAGAVVLMILARARKDGR